MAKIFEGAPKIDHVMFAFHLRLVLVIPLHMSYAVIWSATSWTKEATVKAESSAVLHPYLHSESSDKPAATVDTAAAQACPGQSRKEYADHLQEAHPSDATV